MGIVDRCASSETANMHRTSVVAALLAALVAGSHAISVALKVTPGSVSGKNVVCELAGDTDNFSQTGVSYSIDGSRLFAVEYTGKSVQCCYIEVLAPTTTTTPKPASTTPKPLVMSELGQFMSNMHPCTTGTS